MPAREFSETIKVDCKRCSGLGMVLEVRQTLDTTRRNYALVAEAVWVECPDCTAKPDDEGDKDEEG